MSDIINTTYPTYGGYNTPGRMIGEMAYDTSSNQMMVWSGGNWDTISQCTLDIPPSLTVYEIETIQRIVENISKYEKVLREHFPEDYL